ncbi:MAG TPA: NTP transferase domain-containing protein, partial [Bacteroidales bacterium]|nr:NTP transferase domain-containing protein [Bacteroidales bacterium]
MRKDFSAIILAAGNSSRMRFPKLALKYNDTQTFTEHITKEYVQFGCTEVIVVVNAENYQYLRKQKLPFDEKIKFVVNEHPEWHRFYSLKKGVQVLSKRSKIFVHNVDNPFVNP